MGVFRRITDKGLGRLGLVRRSTMEAAVREVVREYTNREFQAAQLIANAALPRMAKDLKMQGDEAHRRYIEVVEGLRMLE